MGDFKRLQIPLERPRTEKNGAQWHGRVCGFYVTWLTGVGIAIVSEREIGSVQVYPESALEAVSEGKP